MIIPGVFTTSFETGLSLARRQNNWRPDTRANWAERRTIRLRSTTNVIAEIIRVTELFHEDQWRIISCSIRAASLDRMPNIFSDAREVIQEEHRLDGLGSGWVNAIQSIAGFLLVSVRKVIALYESFVIQGVLSPNGG